MPPSQSFGLTEALILKLEALDALSSEERQVIAGLIDKTRTFQTGELLVQEGDRPTHSQLLVSGLAARAKLGPDGARQITSLQIKGDFVDLHGFLLKTMDHDIVALTPCHVAFAPHDRVRAATEALPHLARMLWLNTLIDGAIHRQWVVTLGRQSAESHMAHLFCELFLRFAAVDGTTGNSFPLPITQEVFSDAMGLSTVHVNRMLQELRSKQLIEWRAGVVTIHDFAGLQRLGRFSPDYLSQRREPR